MFQKLMLDVNAIKERDPAARSTFEVLTLYSGLHALLLHRPTHWLYGHHCFYAARLLSQFSRFCTGIEIHPGASIGRGVFIDHGMSVIIGETAVVGNNCTIYQGVTLGGTGKDKGKRHPTLEEDVMVGCGAKVLGPFTVHKGSKIAANAVVLEEIPAYSTCAGVPARVVKQGGQKVQKQDLDQIHIPDPLSQEVCKLLIRIDKLEQRIKQLEGENK